MGLALNPFWKYLICDLSKKTRDRGLVGLVDRGWRVVARGGLCRLVVSRRARRQSAGCQERGCWVGVDEGRGDGDTT